MRFKELSYANENDPRLKRWFIRSMEGLAGRNRYARLYHVWRSSVVGQSARVFGDMLDLIDVGLRVEGAWPPPDLPEGPVVILYGVAPRAAALALGKLREAL